MTPTEYETAWDGWSAIKHLNLGERTGRFAAFYEGRHHVFIDLSGGIIAAIYLSDRRLKIEHVLTRMGLITSDDVQRAFHRLEKIDRITPLSHVLLEQRAMTCRELGVARQRQMIEALQTVMTAERDAVMFIPGPVDVQKVETIIRIDDVLATAFADFRMDSSMSESVQTEMPAITPLLAAGRRLAMIWGEEQEPVLSRQVR